MSLLTARDRIASRFPFFYGWAMLPMATIALMATSPGQTYGIAVFYSSFQESLGLSNTEISGAYMLGTLLGCLPLRSAKSAPVFTFFIVVSIRGGAP